VDASAGGEALMKHVTELGMQAQVMNDVVTQGFALVIDGAVLDDLH